jgi:hypothetical protein
MHTLIVIGVGFLLLLICALTGRVVSGSAGTASGILVFLPIWFFGAAINLYMGVKRAGYSVKEEAPIFLLIFAIPAAVALFAWWKVR